MKSSSYILYFNNAISRNTLYREIWLINVIGYYKCYNLFLKYFRFGFIKYFEFLLNIIKRILLPRPAIKYRFFKEIFNK